MTKKYGADVDLDSILIEIGQFGKYQIFILTLVAFPVLFSAFSATEYIFNAGDRNYRCHIPECEGDPMGADINPGWLTFAIPDGRRCERFSPREDPQDQTCSANIFNVSSVVSCDGYVYEKTNSILYEIPIWEPFPTTIFGSMAILSGLLVLTTPETKGTKLPDTIAEAENVGNKKIKLTKI